MLVVFAYSFNKWFKLWHQRDWNTFHDLWICSTRVVASCVVQVDIRIALRNVRCLHLISIKTPYFMYCLYLIGVFLGLGWSEILYRTVEVQNKPSDANKGDIDHNQIEIVDQDELA